MTYINPRAKPFAHLDRLALWADGKHAAPVTIEWDLSNRCPWGCVDCHFAYTHTKGPWTQATRVLPMAHDKAGDLAETTLVLRVLDEVAQAGVKGIVWTGGGEPSTHPDYLYIWRQAHEEGLEQGLYTLGAALREEARAWMRTHFAWVVVSLDAIDSETYAREKRTPTLTAFARACQAIVDLSVGGTCAVGVSFLLHERNWHQARDMVALARSLGATYATLRPTVRTSPDHPSMPTGNRAWVTEGLPLLDELAQEPDVEVDPARFVAWRDWTTHPYSHCFGVRLNTTITPDGRVWLCPNRREFGGNSCLGDLRTESFAAIWARHPGAYAVDEGCRAMCRLHPVNETLAAVYTARPHEAFI